MKVIIQRTNGVKVYIDDKLHSQTKSGLLVLFGTKRGDVDTSCHWLADKVTNLRIFEDDDGKMNLSVKDIAGELMVISQFTLYADARKGRRPGFSEAMEPSEAEQLYDEFVAHIADSGLVTKTGVFGAKMDIHFNNHGPVTIILEHEL